MSTVIVCIDASDQSKYALDYYLKFVHKDGNQVMIIHCPEDWYHVGVLEGPTPAVVHRLQAEEESKTQAIKEHCQQTLTDYQVDGQFEALFGKHAWEMICKKATEVGAGLIVVGSRGSGKMRRTFMGSCSSSVVHHAHCPVLVCRHKH